MSRLVRFGVDKAENGMYPLMRSMAEIRVNGTVTIKLVDDRGDAGVL